MTQPAITNPDTVLLPLTDIRPYPDNPRRIPDSAVQAVRSSIEKYGYTQPIVVDADQTIVVGHTRYLALLDMGATHAEVFVAANLSPEKASAYRLIDNRTGEMADWDTQALVMELREFSDSLTQEFFPHVDLELDTINDALVTDEDVSTAVTRINSITTLPTLATTHVECPNCSSQFEVRTDSLPGLSKGDLARLKEEAQSGRSAPD